MAGRDGGTMLVALNGGARVTVPGATQAASHASEVTVALRPEAISVHPFAGDADAAPNSAQATVEQIIYRGSLTHLYLRLDDGETLLAFYQNRAGEYAAPRVCSRRPRPGALDRGEQPRGDRCLTPPFAWPSILAAPLPTSCWSARPSG
ncbi:MAG: TOBE domain-containing protein [Acetobacteraceae bacterium]